MNMFISIRSEHAANARDCRSPADARNYYIQAAKGHILSVMEQRARLLKDVSSLHYIGFQVDCGSGYGASADTLESDFVTQQDEAAGKASGLG